MASPDAHTLPEYVRILVVEDDAVEMTHLAILLEELGYEVTASADNALDAMVAFARTRPDLVMLDIHLKGEASGVDLAHKLRELSDVPVLFLTSFADRETYEEARRTLPHAYLTKPIDPLALQSAVELALQQHKRNHAPEFDAPYHQPSGGYFFTKVGNHLKKIALDDIEYIEVEGRYSALVVGGRRYHLKTSLRELHEKLPADRFLRVSRNHVVQLSCIRDIDTQQFELHVGQAVLPVSRTYKDNLMRHIRLL